MDHGHLSLFLVNAGVSFSRSSAEARGTRAGTTTRVSVLPSLLAGGVSTFLGVKEGSGCADAHPVLLT